MEILGQDHIRNTWRAAAERGSLHHAYLLVGPPGLGQPEAALWLAQLANCTGDEGQGMLLGDAPPDEKPCGTCHNCRLTAARNHPDVSWVTHSERIKTRKITIEQAREVRTELLRRPVLGRRKIVVLHPADDLTLEAVNALLKTLEEPPEYATLVLLAADTGNVPATILSRCQVARFRPVPPDILVPYLEAHGADADTARLLAALSEGRPGVALGWLAHPEQLAAREQSLAWLEAVSEARPPDALRLAEQLREGLGGEDAQNADTAAVLGWAETWYRDILAAQCGMDAANLIHRDRAAAVRRAAARRTPAQIQTALAAIVRARRYLAGNGNATLVTETLLFDLIPA